jgi:hypothetical protein
MTAYRTRCIFTNDYTIGLQFYDQLFEMAAVETDEPVVMLREYFYPGAFAAAVGRCMAIAVDTTIHPSTFWEDFLVYAIVGCFSGRTLKEWVLTQKKLLPSTPAKKKTPKKGSQPSVTPRPKSSTPASASKSQKGLQSISTKTSTKTPTKTLPKTPTSTKSSTASKQIPKSASPKAKVKTCLFLF